MDRPTRTRDAVPSRVSTQSRLLRRRTAPPCAEISGFFRARMAHGGAVARRGDRNPCGSSHEAHECRGSNGESKRTRARHRRGGHGRVECSSGRPSTKRSRRRGLVAALNRHCWRNGPSLRAGRSATQPARDVVVLSAGQRDNGRADPSAPDRSETPPWPFSIQLLFDACFPAVRVAPSSWQRSRSASGAASTPPRVA